MFSTSSLRKLNLFAISLQSSDTYKFGLKCDGLRNKESFYWRQNQNLLLSILIDLTK